MQPHANNTDVQDHSEPAVEIRSPKVGDAAHIWQLVCDCEVLDTNSCYAYLLVCRDFAATSLIATAAERLLGFVAAYIPPSRPDVVFVWQIGVAPTARNMGLARSLLLRLISSGACRGVRYLEATVTPSNSASMCLFQSTAEAVNSELNVLPGFAVEDFGTATHEAEATIRISLNRRDYEVI